MSAHSADLRGAFSWRCTSIAAVLALALTAPCDARAQSTEDTMDSPPAGAGGLSVVNQGGPAMPGMPSPMAPSAGAGNTMPGMDRAPVPAAEQATMPAMNGARDDAGLPMPPMQGGKPPPNPRSADYSDGIGYGSTKGMEMDDNASVSMVLIDQLESFHGQIGNGQTWEAQASYGNDADKLWLRTQGERVRDKLQEGDGELFWNHNVTTYWSTQLGTRHDFGEGTTRSWAAFGLQGLAPYWFELEATAYLGPSGRTAARLRSEYDLLLTQRLILQPEFEVNVYGKTDPARRIGSGVSDMQLGMRFRYEIRRQFAPYIGVLTARRFGASAAFARDDHQRISDRQWVAGFRIWF